MRREARRPRDDIALQDQPAAGPVGGQRVHPHPLEQVGRLVGRSRLTRGLREACGGGALPEPGAHLGVLYIALASLLANLLQALPGLARGWRFVLLALPPLLTSGLGGSMIALMSEILPAEAFILGRATLNIAVGVMQIVGFGAGGLLLLRFTTSELFLGAAGQWS